LPQGAPQDAIRESPDRSSLENTFLSQKRYPGEIEPPSLPSPPAQPASPHVFTRIVLPLLIFVVAVGVLAWAIQWLPSQGRPTDDKERPPPIKEGDKRLLYPDGPGWLSLDPNTKSFIFTASWETRMDPFFGAETAGLLGSLLGQGSLLTVARFVPERVYIKHPMQDPLKTAYLPEYEVFTDELFDPGYYDFIFKNVAGQSVEVGLESQGCRCSRVEACALADAEWAAYRKAHEAGNLVKHTPREGVKDGLPWSTLPKDAKAGLLVPAGSQTVVRLHWDGHKEEPEQVQLTAKIWASPAGKSDARQHVAQLVATVAYVRPVHFFPEKVEVGALSSEGASASASFECWSATRDLKVEVDRSKEQDPRFTFTATPLTEEECRDLEKRLSARDIATRVRSAYRVSVRVHERKDGKQLDLGAFHKQAPLLISGNGKLLTKVHLPRVRGMVLGEIRLGALEDQDKINLKFFKSSFGTSATVQLWAKPHLELQYVDFTPAHLNLDVKLKKTDQRVSDWRVWEVKVTVPPNAASGPFPEDSAIQLRAANQKPPRLMRLPLVGTASRN
ncbi:MAG TPA: hypothetical protein VEL76_12045, partial [Gemmataceae bacterium]|nr:hypothetical protein [Gemmataceae bacterium]